MIAFRLVWSTCVTIHSCGSCALWHVRVESLCTRLRDTSLSAHFAEIQFRQHDLSTQSANNWQWIARTAELSTRLRFDSYEALVLPSILVVRVCYGTCMLNPCAPDYWHRENVLVSPVDISCCGTMLDSESGGSVIESYCLLLCSQCIVLCVAVNFAYDSLLFRVRYHRLTCDTSLSAYFAEIQFRQHDLSIQSEN